VQVDCFRCLGHHVIIGCDNDDGNVGKFCTAGAHGGEGFVAGRIEEAILCPLFVVTS